MKKWKYLKGGESDFEGHSDDKVSIIKRGGTDRFGHPLYIELARRQLVDDEEQDLNECIGAPEANVKVGELHCDGNIHTAQLGDGDIPALRAEVGSKYHREIKPGAFVDVYDVLAAWNVTNPALQHLIKKALQPGARGHKTTEQDMQDIIDSAIRAKQLGA